MSKNPRTKYHVRKRMFLNRDLDMRAFAIGIVEDTRDIPNDEENGWQYGTIQLNLADCYRHVSFDFNLNTKEARADSLYKIRRIAAIVNAVCFELGVVTMIASHDSITCSPFSKQRAPVCAATRCILSGRIS